MKATTKRFALLLAALAAAASVLAVMLLFLSSAAVVTPVHAAMPAGAGDWFITANNTGSNVYIGNTIYERLYGPFGGIFGSEGGGMFDIPVSPDGKTAVVSNFGDGAVYFLDVTDPAHPAIDLTRPISVDIGFFAEDIAITPDGKYALVTDGGFSPVIATIDMATHQLVTVTNISEHDAYANAVDVGPDGTVIVADYFAVTGTLHTLVIDDDGLLTFAHTYSYWHTVGEFIGRPVNVAIAPDGQTVVACDAQTAAVPIYEITAPGVLEWKGWTEPVAENPIPAPRPPVVSAERQNQGRMVESEIDAFAVSGPGIQSVAFNTDGTRAYVVINGRRDEEPYPIYNQVGMLDINGPGDVEVSSDAPVTLYSSSSSQLFGVDTIAVAGRKVYVGQPTVSILTGTNLIHMVDLNTFEVFTHEIAGVATGISTIPLNQIHIPVIQGG